MSGRQGPRFSIRMIIWIFCSDTLWWWFVFLLYELSYFQRVRRQCCLGERSAHPKGDPDDRHQGGLEEQHSLGDKTDWHATQGEHVVPEHHVVPLQLHDHHHHHRSSPGIQRHRAANLLAVQHGHLPAEQEQGVRQPSHPHTDHRHAWSRLSGHPVLQRLPARGEEKADEPDRIDALQRTLCIYWTSHAGAEQRKLSTEWISWIQAYCTQVLWLQR